MAGQRLFNHQGLLGGGADHHRQPVRVHLPPLLLAGRLREVSPRQAGGNGSAPKGAGASGLGWYQSWWRASPRGEPLWLEARQGLLDQGGSRGPWWAGPSPSPAWPVPLLRAGPVVWPQELRGPALGLYTAGAQEGRLPTVVVNFGRRQEAQASPRGQCAFSVTSRGHPGPSSRSSRPEHPGSSSRGPCPASRAQPRLPRWAFPDGHRRASVALGPSCAGSGGPVPSPQPHGALSTSLGLSSPQGSPSA